MTPIRHFGHHIFPYYTHVGLHGFQDDKSGKLSLIFCLFFLSLVFYNNFLVAPLGDSRSPEPYAVARSTLLLAGSS